MEEPKTIYGLDMHEEIGIDDGVFVRRVPGGWIYTIWNGAFPASQVSSVFVPFTPKTLNQ